MRTANPALNEQAFNAPRVYGSDQAMSIHGTVNKSFILLAILVAAASWIWSQFGQPGVAPSVEGVVTPRLNVSGYIMIGAIVGFIVALVTVFRKEWSPVTAPIYAGCEGLVLGAVSAMFELRYPGIVIQAVALTFGTLFCLLLAYKSGWVRPSENFKLGIVAATGAIALVYFVSLILGFFKINIPLFGSGPIGIIFSLIVVTIAALNLVLDFDFIEQGASQGAPKYMEWYGAFGLMVTLVWLYLEILRLLAKMRDRD